MAKTKSNASKGNLQRGAGGARTLMKSAPKSATAKPTATSTSKAKPAARTTARPRTAARKTQSRGARQEGAPALTPIRKHQSRAQIISAIARDSGVERSTAERVARSLSTTLTRHLMRGGSGRVEIPYLGAALWRGRQAAQKPRTMFSPLLSRNVQIPARKAQPAARFRVHRALRELVQRV